MVDSSLEKKLDCTVVIVSFNTRALTDKCLTIAEKAAFYSHQILGNKTEIIVVDNASTDGTVEMIRKKHPKVTLMALKENIRYARGNNVGLKKADTPLILILNSDAFLEKNTYVKLLQHMEKNSHYDALCCQLTFADGSFQTVGGYLPTPFNTIIWSLGIDSFPVLKHFIHPIYNHNKRFYKKERPIEWCSGAFMLIKKDVYKKTGGFDENLFFYMEDVEWCKRIKDAGFKLYFTPTVSLVHLAGQSSKKLVQKTKLQNSLSGKLYYISKFYPKYLNLIAYSMQMGMYLRWIFYSLIGKRENAAIYKETVSYLD